VAGWRPSRLRLTHFGCADAVDDQLERARSQLRSMGELTRDADREGFLRAIDAQIDSEVTDEAGVRLRQAAPPAQLWLGLERYWRKRA
jgi:hypothetical protein